ncbi:phage tail sheath C-terminal domain-containing protein [Caballeronia sp. LZ029]|uniref:phage tail sheath C-terminal domain-containing protein n=1 Tax=Caballeronia sp. LZ029 TaxID=3038564 RepID=UPI0028640E18|nr:phage tail sheath C-terminal domain-containing protein [Caballeronia sp. LZ029]MDR5748836.1 phage tail sheath C-terminal domain-containing protein [Caballeronia sp. LZ029]
MAEVITETILPGTYITVNTEGLLGVGPLATGNIGIVGTAERGSTEIQTLSSAEDARARFGQPGLWDRSAPDENLSLARSVQLLFDNGASTVYAARVMATEDNSANGVQASKGAAFTIGAASGAGTLTLQARTPGTWGNRVQIRSEPADAEDQVQNELLVRSSSGFALSAQQVGAAGATDPATSLGSVSVREHGLSQRYTLTTGPASADSVQLNAADRTLTFNTAPGADAEVRASYRVPKEALCKVTIQYGNQKEQYITPSLSNLNQQLQDAPSGLVIAAGPNGDGLPKISNRFDSFTGGTNGTVALSHYIDALEGFVTIPVQIVMVAGQPFSRVKSALLAHVEKTENLGHERIAIVGADSSDVSKILANANDVADKRVVLVAPGLLQTDPDSGETIELPPTFAAAAIAGKLASLAPPISITNKTLSGIDALAADYNYGDLKALVQNRVLALEMRRGVRVVKGITTDDQAFAQITLRRIVDYVKEGTRIGANQYIGRLNNTRVRENLRTTLDGFLASLQRDDFLTGYKITVFADRAMEINGEVRVIMDLNPTFSIDVIRVVMNLS